MRHFKILENLALLAKDVAPVGSARIVAAVRYRGRTIAYGCNQLKSHSFQARFGKNKQSVYLHAETDAIKNALRRLTENELRRCSLYVARVKTQDESLVWGLAKPCTGCQKTIATYGIRNVYFTTNEGSVGFLQLVDGRVVEGTPLLREQTGNTVSRVRIPLNQNQQREKVWAG